MVAGNPIRHIGYTEEWYKSLKEKGYDLRTGRMNINEKKEFLLTLDDDKFVQKPYIKCKDDK